MTTGKRVHTGEEWARSLERRLTRLEQDLMNQSAWTGEQGYVPSWWGTCANTSVASGSVVTMSAWTRQGGYRIPNPSGTTWTLSDAGVYVFGLHAKFSVQVSGRSFIEMFVNGQQAGRQVIVGSGSEDRVGASFTVHANAGSTVWFSVYQATGSTQTLTEIRLAMVRVAAG